MITHSYLILVQGSFENLEAIRKAGVKVCFVICKVPDLMPFIDHVDDSGQNMQCPLLCKEFIVDAWQLYYARTKGADAVLLIAAVLPDLDIKYMIKICKLLGLTALVEVKLALFYLFPKSELCQLQHYFFLSFLISYV